MRRLMVTAMAVSQQSERPSTVCIIGAGAGGLVAGKVMRSAGLDVEVYEQSSEVGGIWRRHGHVVYDSLRCNLPHQIMQFRGFPFDVKSSFAYTADVTDYLEAYCGDDEVHLDSRISRVRRDEDDRGWLVTVEGVPDPKFFDFIVVANGHYERVAPEPFDHSTFSGIVLHSKDYFRPEEYRGKTVICVGARSSGTDIAKELTSVAKRVVVADKSQEKRKEYGSNLVHSPPIAEFRDYAVEFVDGSVESHVDAVILCHGFEYDFPFFLDQEVVVEDRCVRPLYLDMFHVDFPSLVFLGIPHSIVPFPLMQIQSILAASVFTGKTELPDDVEGRRRQLDEKLSALARLKDAHHLGNGQWDYSKYLLRLSQVEDLDGWLRFVETNREIYNHVGPRRPKIPGSPDVYRQLEYAVDHDKGKWICVNEKEIDDLSNLTYSAL